MQTKSSGLAGVALARSGRMLAVAILGQHGCGDEAALPAGPANATARKEIPPKLLPLFQQVAERDEVYWQILAGISKEACTFGQDSDPQLHHPLARHRAGAGQRCRRGRADADRDRRRCRQ